MKAQVLFRGKFLLYLNLLSFVEVSLVVAALMLFAIFTATSILMVIVFLIALFLLHYSIKRIKHFYAVVKPLLND